MRRSTLFWKVIYFLAAEGLLSADRIALLDSWKSGHTGFSAHNAVTIQADDPDGLELLACLLIHIPEPRRHVVRYYGHYAHVSRARCSRYSTTARSAEAAVHHPSEA